MNRLLVSISVFAFCLGVQVPVQEAAGQDQSYRPKTGQSHVAFKLPTIDGKEMIELSDFRGKKLLLFHFASW